MSVHFCSLVIGVLPVFSERLDSDQGRLSAMRNPRERSLRGGENRCS